MRDRDVYAPETGCDESVLRQIGGHRMRAYSNNTSSADARSPRAVAARSGAGPDAPGDAREPSPLHVVRRMVLKGPRALGEDGQLVNDDALGTAHSIHYECEQSRRLGVCAHRERERKASRCKEISEFRTFARRGNRRRGVRPRTAAVRFERISTATKSTP